MEMDAASNAGHVVEPAKEIQSCPYVPVTNAANAATKTVLLMSRRPQAFGVGPCDVPRIVLPRTFMLRSGLHQYFDLGSRGVQRAFEYRIRCWVCQADRKVVSG